MLFETHSMRVRRLLTVVSLFLSLMSANPTWARAKEKVLYAFGGVGDGAFPYSSLTWDASGNLYGTTMHGGNLSICSAGCGTVFKLTPSADGHWREKALYAFQAGTDGAYPIGNLVFDAVGNLYGTTAWGGTPNKCTDAYLVGCGTVFELSPNSDGSWSETVLYRFQGSGDGSQPGFLIFDAAGNLYGTSTGSGYTDGATVFELSPPRKPGGTWTEQVLYAFDNTFETPNASLALDAHGNIFGTTQAPYCNQTCGRVFELSPINGSWVETSIYQFPTGGNGDNPMAGVTLATDGDIYGTTYKGGNNFGVAFKLSITSGQWHSTLLYNFCSDNKCGDGAHPLASLVFDKAGNLYGTTYDGGRGCANQGCGTVFKLTHTKSGWTRTLLYRFANDPRGSNPAASLIFDNAGNLYGTTVYDAGGGGFGTVFEITP